MVLHYQRSSVDKIFKKNHFHKVNEWNRLSADCVGASSVNIF